ncbi:Zinc transporter 11-like protein [Drosera capensis]
MMHFLSDSNEMFGDLTSKGHPFAFMLACAGYLLTMLADVVILYVYGKRRAAGRRAGDGIEVRNWISGQQAHESTGHFPPQLAAASSVGDTILLIMALCFHSVFKGIAIGVAETKACLESPVDNFPPQDLCCHCHGHSPAQNDPRQTASLLYHLRLPLCHLEPHRCWHWDHYRCNNRRCQCRLDLRHIYGTCM